MLDVFKTLDGILSYFSIKPVAGGPVHEVNPGNIVFDAWYVRGSTFRLKWFPNDGAPQPKIVGITTFPPT